uniref:Uncharacterized protein n=1 Tax=viral metagenome TaxID=1070528 RepID=A0A6H1ZVQ9_9ZZZZ
MERKIGIERDSRCGATLFGSLDGKPLAYSKHPGEGNGYELHELMIPDSMLRFLHEYLQEWYEKLPPESWQLPPLACGPGTACGVKNDPAYGKGQKAYRGGLGKEGISGGT